MGLWKRIRQRWDRLGTLEARMDSLETEWTEKRADLLRLEGTLRKRDQRATSSAATTPEQPRAGWGEGETPEVARYRMLRDWRQSKGR